jgi:hypothetical protein
MAGDWVKVEYTTPEKPEVYAVAHALGITQAEAFHACFRIWRWFDANTTDGYARSVTECDTDAFAGYSGVTQALINEGWMLRVDGGLQIPHFDYHMSESAKKRAQSAKRMQVLRSRRNKCDADSVTNASPEKRREEVKTTPLPPKGGWSSKKKKLELPFSKRPENQGL